MELAMIIVINLLVISPWIYLFVLRFRVIRVRAKN
jgi:hypothetical protein